MDKIWAVQKCLGRTIEQADLTRWLMRELNRHTVDCDGNIVTSEQATAASSGGGGYFVYPDHVNFMQNSVSMRGPTHIADSAGGPPGEDNMIVVADPADIDPDAREMHESLWSSNMDLTTEMSF